MRKRKPDASPDCESSHRAKPQQTQGHYHHHRTGKTMFGARQLFDATRAGLTRSCPAENQNSAQGIMSSSIGGSSTFPKTQPLPDLGQRLKRRCCNKLLDAAAAAVAVAAAGKILHTVVDPATGMVPGGCHLDGLLAYRWLGSC